MVVEWDTTTAPCISSQDATPEEHAGKEQPCAQMVPESQCFLPAGLACLAPKILFWTDRERKTQSMGQYCLRRAGEPCSGRTQSVEGDTGTGARHR